MKLSIVIPAFNEEARLRPTLDVYSAFYERLYGNNFEIIVAVNGSVDHTEDVARDVARIHPQVKVVVDPGKIGKGGAILMGFRAAKGDIVGFVDADGSTQPDAYQDLVEHIGDAGCIIASRWMPGATVSPKQPMPRRIASRIFNSLVRTLFSVKITDTQCGAKVLSRKALDAVLPRIGLTRWAFDVDLLFQIRRAGFRIEERPTVWHDVGGSRLKVGRASTEMFIAIVRLRLLYSPFKWVVTVYDKTVGRFIHVTR